MVDVRPKTMDIELKGKTYRLVCNMNVLADVQAQNDGNLSGLLKSRETIRSSLQFLAAMVNEAANANGWPERYTAKELGRELSWAQFTEISGQIKALVAAAIVSPEADADSAEEDTEKKQETSKTEATA